MERVSDADLVGSRGVQGIESTNSNFNLWDTSHTRLRDLAALAREFW